MHTKVSVTCAEDGHFQGVWLSQGKDDVHVHDAQMNELGKGVVLGHNVNQCAEDKAARVAVCLIDGEPIRVQNVNPETHEVSTKTITADEFYAKFLTFLESL